MQITWTPKYPEHTSDFWRFYVGQMSDLEEAAVSLGTFLSKRYAGARGLHIARAAFALADMTRFARDEMEFCNGTLVMKG